MACHPPAPGGDELARIRSAYLTLMCDSLVGRLNQDPPLQEHLDRYDEEHRLNGWDWPSGAPSMIGRRRMANLRDECERVIRDEVPGDFLEAGVWRGGASIMMRAVLDAYGIRDRRVIAADTFCGLPQDTDEHDPAAFLRDIDVFSVSLDDVKNAFQRYGLLDEQVVFLKGPFKETFPTVPVTTLAVLRLDGDTYESARDGLSMLYDKLSSGGSLIVDDYFLFDGNRQAVDEFRTAQGISEPIVQIDDYGGYWVKG